MAAYSTVPEGYPCEETIWLDHTLGRMDAYLMRVELLVSGVNSGDSVATACRELVRRHPLLRSVYVEQGGRLRRNLLDIARIPVVTLPSGTEPPPFSADPSTGPLVDFNIRAERDSIHSVLVRAHHLVLDGSAKPILARDLARVLAGVAAPAASVPPGGFGWFTREEVMVAAAYWRDLAPEPLRLPTNGGEGLPGHKNSVRLTLDAAIHGAVVEIAKQAAASPLHVLLGRLALLFHRYGNQHPVIGLVVDLRDAHHAETVGCAASIMPVQLTPDPAADPLGNARMARDRILGHRRFAAIPARQLLWQGALGSVTSVPDFQRFNVSYQRVTQTRFPAGEVTVTLLNAETTAGAVGELVLHVIDDGERFVLQLDGDAARWSSDALADLTHQITAAFCGDPAKSQRTVTPGHMPAGREPASIEPVRIEQAFAQLVAVHPEAIAVVDADGEKTYCELWDDARSVAAALAARGIRPGEAIGLYGYPSYQSVLGMLAVLIAGCHYVPFSPEFPAPRVTELLLAARARCLLLATPAGVAVNETIPSWPVSDLLAAGRELPPATLISSDDLELAYLIFTSGSTGTPKGVAVPHRGVVRLVRNGGGLQLAPTDGVLAHTTLTFDVSMYEIWGALLVGARLVMLTEYPASLGEMAKVLADPQVSVAWFTSPMFGLMVDSHLEALKSLRLVIAGGDVVPPRQARQFIAACPSISLVNGYGPTENTIFSTTYDIRRWLPEKSPSVPIGSPIGATRCYILDEHLRPVSPGTIGELYLGGDQLARGYLNSPALTAQRFLPDPFTATPGAHMYRTGDSARLLPDGTLQFHGRADAEVKVRGIRINLTEVEAALTADPGVAECVAIMVGEEPERCLVGYVRWAAEQADSRMAVDELRRRCLARVPAFLVPGVIIPVREFPLGPAGKIDKSALPTSPRLPELDPAAEGCGTDLASSGTADVTYRVTGTTALLAALWQRHFGSLPSMEDDLIAAGGDSLAVLRLVDDIRREFAVEIKLNDVYQATSFGELLALTEQQGGRPGRST